MDPKKSSGAVKRAAEKRQKFRSLEPGISVSEPRVRTSPTDMPTQDPPTTDVRTPLYIGRDPGKMMDIGPARAPGERPDPSRMLRETMGPGPRAEEALMAAMAQEAGAAGDDEGMEELPDDEGMEGEAPGETSVTMPAGDGHEVVITRRPTGLPAAVQRRRFNQRA